MHTWRANIFWYKEQEQLILLTSLNLNLHRICSQQLFRQLIVRDHTSQCLWRQIDACVWLRHYENFDENRKQEKHLKSYEYPPSGQGVAIKFFLWELNVGVRETRGRLEWSMIAITQTSQLFTYIHTHHPTCIRCTTCHLSITVTCIFYRQCITLFPRVH